MNSERALRKKVCEIIRSSGGHAQAHEDAHSSGIPDVSYALRGYDGWLEIKRVATRPAREKTPIYLDRHREKFARQLLWLGARERAGFTRCLVLAQIGDDFLLFNPAGARKALDGLTWNGLLEAATVVWRKPFGRDNLLVRGLTELGCSGGVPASSVTVDPPKRWESGNVLVAPSVWGRAAWQIWSETRNR